MKLRLTLIRTQLKLNNDFHLFTYKQISYTIYFVKKTGVVNE